MMSWTSCVSRTTRDLSIGCSIPTRRISEAFIPDGLLSDVNSIPDRLIVEYSRGETGHVVKDFGRGGS